jgi:hypothetical protein
MSPNADRSPILYRTTKIGLCHVGADSTRARSQFPYRTGPQDGIGRTRPAALSFTGWQHTRRNPPVRGVQNSCLLSQDDLLTVQANTAGKDAQGSEVGQESQSVQQLISSVSG